ncbi:MAG: dihydroorotate dehydrogenase [Acidimicrobiia bacterium]|nr:dihydroorotate dehydrogenase [Acidimicrobiia bacterium]
MAAAGTFGHGDEVAGVCDPRGLGAVTVKSLAAFAWPGNPAPRVCPTSGGGMLNSVGLAGPGVERWIIEDLPALKDRGARIIVSVWGRSIEEFAAAAEPLGRVAGDLTAVEVNVSCPNIEDRSRMFAHAPAMTGAAIRAVRNALESGGGDALPVFAKLSPNTSELVEVAGAALEAGAAGLTLVNTLLGLAIDAERRSPALGAGGGGLSGPPMKAVALRAVWEVARAHPGTAIIGTGGVGSGLDAVEMLLAGAVRGGGGDCDLCRATGRTPGGRRAEGVVRTTGSSA